METEETGQREEAEAQIGDGGSAKSKLTVVGIGASAGGLAALKIFFSHVPGDSGLAFVVIIHLSPEHESHLAELLQPHVKMPVMQVNETTKLEVNRVYIIPPGRNLSAVDTHLRLSDLEERRREGAPIDHFFRTLAKTHDGASVAVILTGTGSDGTLGLREVKQHNGFAVVQDPYEAEFDGMPQSAIATGLVDLILPLAKIPEAIVRFTQTEPRVPVPEDGGDVEDEVPRRLLHKVFAQLRARTGRDFSRYKRSTILRRIQRRMQLRNVEEFPAYLDLLGEQPEEARALADDFLITVTHFFRDQEVFELLEKKVIPQLFEGKEADDSLRVWSVGCATGEEAYSLTILLLEEAARHEVQPQLQVFASDLHERSLRRARDGFYPGDIEADVSPERLKRFFQKEDGGYRIHREVRERVVFAPHNLLGDPPFSRLDLVACRNVLMYLQRNVQKDVIEMFHYALRPEGFLLVGTDETVDSADLFRLEDRKQCLYRKRNVASPEPHLPVFSINHGQHAVGRGEPFGERLEYGALHQQMVEMYAPPSLLVSPDDRVVNLSRHAGRYLVHPGGELTANIFLLVREELRVELRLALYGARERSEPVRSKPVPVQLDGETRAVVLDVRPALEPEKQGFTLVVFDERTTAEPGSPTGAVLDGSGGMRLRELEAERDLSQQRLQAALDRNATSQEELRASNEELQSANEELQSMNEELQTVNQENRHKSDLQNLLAATDIATLFLDRDLRILQFTPKVGELFNVRPVDRGRPLSDITHRLGYNELQSDAKAVLRRLVPIEGEVQDEAGGWYLTRVRPYQSTEDRIEGVVITFIEITERKQTEEALRASEARYRLLVESAREYAIFMLDPQGRITAWNTGARRIFGYTGEEVVGRHGAIIFTEEDRAAGVPEAEMETALREGKASDDRWHVRKDGSRFWANGVMESLRQPDGSLRGFSKVLRDNTERKQAEEALRASEERFRTMAETVPDIVFTSSAEGVVDYVNPQHEAFTGAPPEEVLGTVMWPELVHPDDRAHAEASWADACIHQRRFEVRYRLWSRGGEYCWVIVRASPVYDEGGVLTRWFGTVTDVNALTLIEEEVRRLNETLELRVKERTQDVRDLAARLTLAEQQERQRIAQILHDDLQQQLYGLGMTLGLLRKAKAEAEAHRLYDQANEVLDQATELTRTLVTELSPPVLNSSNLEEILQWLRLREMDQHGLDIQIEMQGEVSMTDHAFRVLLYNALREVLFNVVKHAGMLDARITVREEASDVVVQVDDEGAGFDMAALEVREPHKGGFGLTSVRERMELVGGRFRIESKPGAGTRVTLALPLQKEEDARTQEGTQHR